jgi:hypothetical protein
LLPSTASSSEPHVERIIHSRPGSTLRLSQPLSGFPASSSSTALFRAATVPESSLQSLPLTRSATPLEAPCSLAVIHRRARRATRDLSPPVSPTPTLLTQSPGSPDGYELPFGRPAPTSRSLWISNDRVALTASFTRLEALFPL